MSSSITSLEPLSRSVQSIPHSGELPVSRTPQTLSEEDTGFAEKENGKNMDVVEVGRGLANYNSAQITKVKGLNR
jgi:glutamate 5-kinase